MSVKVWHDKDHGTPEWEGPYFVAVSNRDELTGIKLYKGEAEKVVRELCDLLRWQLLEDSVR